MDHQLKESAGNFVLQLISSVQALNARADQLEHTVQELTEAKVDKFWMEKWIENWMETYNSEAKDMQSHMQRLKADIDGMKKTHSLEALQQYVSQLEEQTVTLINDLKINKANQKDVEALAGLLDDKCDELDFRVTDKSVMAELTEKVEVIDQVVGQFENKFGQFSSILENKANIGTVTELSATLQAKANKQDLRRFHRVNLVNMYRNSQKVFQQQSGCVVNDYRVNMVMDIGFKYKMAIQVLDHNRGVGEFIEAAVALLPQMASAWMNCDWGVGKGWTVDGQKPGVGLMNLHGQYKSSILTTGDVLDITLDHHTGQHLVEFSKRGTEIRCRRRVAAAPVNLIISLWGKAGLEIVEFDVVDAA